MNDHPMLSRLLRTQFGVVTNDQLLASGMSARTLSGPTAARLYGVRGMPSERIWGRATKPTRERLPDWLVRTTSAWLLESDAAVHRRGSWRLLAPAPMLLTLAEQFNDHRFERAAEDAWHLKLITPQEAAIYLDAWRGPGRRWVGRFERWLQRAGARPRPSQSGFEVDVVQGRSAAQACRSRRDSTRSPC